MLTRQGQTQPKAKSKAKAELEYIKLLTIKCSVLFLASNNSILWHMKVSVTCLRSTTGILQIFNPSSFFLRCRLYECIQLRSHWWRFIKNEKPCFHHCGQFKT